MAGSSENEAAKLRETHPKKDDTVRIPDVLAGARRVISEVALAETEQQLIWREANLEKEAYAAWVNSARDRAEARYSKQNQDDDLSSENWLELECLSLKTEASCLSESLDQTLDYVKNLCNAVSGSA